MSLRWAFLGLSAVLLGMTACDASESGSGPSGFERTDSSGVTILTNAQPERPLFLSEALSIGLVEGDPDYLFHQVRAIGLDDEGGTWIVDSNESVRHYDNAGSYSGAIGGRGEGPGEAEGYADVWVGDTGILVLGYPSTLQLFGREGTFLDGRPARDGRRTIMPLGYGRNHWTFRLLTFPDEPGDLFRRRVSIARVSGPVSEMNPTGSFPGRLFRMNEWGGAGAGPYFLGDPSYGMDGKGRMFISDTLDYRIEVYDPDGALAQVITREVEPVLFDPGWVSEIEEGIWATLRQDGLPSNAAEQVERMMAGALPSEPPAHLPFIERVIVAKDGPFWVERADRHPRPAAAAVAHLFGWVRHAWPPEWTAPLVFDLFTAEGEYRGTVEIDPRFAPMAVTPDRVYGVRYDELGVETVVALALSQTRSVR